MPALDWAIPALPFSRSSFFEALVHLDMCSGSWGGEIPLHHLSDSLGFGVIYFPSILTGAPDLAEEKHDAAATLLHFKIVAQCSMNGVVFASNTSFRSKPEPFNTCLKRH